MLILYLILPKFFIYTRVKETVLKPGRVGDKGHP